MVAVGLMGADFDSCLRHRHCGDDDGATPKFCCFRGGSSYYFGGSRVVDMGWFNQPPTPAPTPVPHQYPNQHYWLGIPGAGSNADSKGVLLGLLPRVRGGASGQSALLGPLGESPLPPVGGRTNPLPARGGLTVSAVLLVRRTIRGRAAPKNIKRRLHSHRRFSKPYFCITLFF